MLLTLLSAALAQDPADPLAAMDWDAAREELAQVLSGYLQVDTTNPPGNEVAGAQYLAGILEREGIASEIWEYAPGRADLIARLDSPIDAEPPLCLLSHIDVVTVEPESWPAENQPFSGNIAPDPDGEMAVWGRGALDMKGMGAIELMTLVWLKRLDLPLSRDVVLLAVADEEVDNEGAQALVRERWGEIGCSHVINEGGMGVEDLLFEGQTAYAISVGEKGVLWLRMVASGSPGHGSVPKPDEAPERLRLAVNAVVEMEPDPRIDPSILELLSAVGAQRSGLERLVLTNPGLAQRFVLPKLMANPVTRAAITDTAHLTGFSGALSPNVLPSEAVAYLDCRLLPGTTDVEMIERLSAAVNDPQVRFEVLSYYPAAVSVYEGDPFFDALVHQTRLADPEAVVGPALSVGFTDSIFLRGVGVRAYGLVPMRASLSEMATMHGDAERVPVAELERGLRVLLGATVEAASKTR